MREVQLYIGDDRLDLYPDETIEVTSSIQDAKDISKVFTDYSKTFSIPASATNNKIFKHFNNFNISNGFDGRVRHDSSIYINHLLYKRGKLFLNGVSMKNGKPSSYRVTFFGNTVSLKDKFADQKLYSLDWSDFDFTWSRQNVKTIFSGTGKTVNGDTSALIFPLITPKKRLFYDSSLDHTDNQNFSGNLYAPTTYPTDVDELERYTVRGVNESDLKPAIKVYQIIKLIEDKFDLVFIPSDTAGTKDFFSKHNDAISNLYLWISNSAGSIVKENDEGNYFYSTIPDNFVTDSQTDDDFSWFSYSNGEFTISTGFDDVALAEHYYDFKIHVNPTSLYNSVNWRVKLINKETGRFQTIEGSGSRKELVTIPNSLNEDQVYYIEFSSQEPMIETEIKFEARQDKGGVPSDFEIYTTKGTDNNNAGTNTTTQNIRIKNEVPDMKIIDFVTGLFKMFNLTAYVIDDENDSEYGTDTLGNPNVIKVMTLDDYYDDAVNNQSGGLIDVTKYIDVTSHVVDTSLPFSEIDFKYEENETVIKANHLETFGESFGDSNLSISNLYPDTDFFFGEKYEVKPPFTILKYEKIAGTDIQWGYAAGGDFDTTEGDFTDSDEVDPPTGDYTSENIKPLLFYGVRETSHDDFNFGSASGSAAAKITSGYYRPSNTNETVTVDSDGVFSTPPSYALTFDAEIDEFVLNDFGSSSNSLFNKFYKKYITSVFDPTKRMFKYTAYLPASFLVKYKLNDQLKIQDVVYRINSITVNLTTGKSELELINLNQDEIV